MIPRSTATTLDELLRSSSAVALLGPRQVGKTTLARDIADALGDGAVYLDLERPADLRRLSDADAYLRSLAPQLVILDEVHRVPELFPILRGIIDDNRRAGFRYGQFLLLGSASLDLVNLSAESLAGRLSRLELGGVDVIEASTVKITEERLWLRGGFPDSLEAPSDEVSLRWRTDLIRSYLERDVPMFAPRLPAETLRRLWTMLAHTSGGLFNASRLATSLGVSGQTVDRYVDLLVDLMLVRRSEPWLTNTQKRLTKAPKIYVRDSGLIHALLEITTTHQLMGHPSVGASYESFAVETLISAAPADLRPHHYRTARGDEIDLLFVRGGQPAIAIEIKRSSAPVVSGGFHRACDDLGVEERYLVHPGEGVGYPSGPLTVAGLTTLAHQLRASG